MIVRSKPPWFCICGVMLNPGCTGGKNIVLKCSYSTGITAEVLARVHHELYGDFWDTVVMVSRTHCLGCWLTDYWRSGVQAPAHLSCHCLSHLLHLTLHSDLNFATGIEREKKSLCCKVQVTNNRITNSNRCDTYASSTSPWKIMLEGNSDCSKKKKILFWRMTAHYSPLLNFLWSSTDI